MSKYSTSDKRKKATWAAWGSDEGRFPGALSEAVRLGGRVSRAEPAPQAGGNGHGGGSRTDVPPIPGGDRDECHALVRRALDAERVREAVALDALGERRQAREVREDLFVRLLALWCDCAGAVLVQDAVNGLAFLLRVSPATTKRYLRAHASPFGEFALDGDFVRLRQ